VQDERKNEIGTEQENEVLLVSVVGIICVDGLDDEHAGNDLSCKNTPFQRFIFVAVEGNFSIRGIVSERRV
jgi:hypothetical protein